MVILEKEKLQKNKEVFDSLDPYNLKDKKNLTPSLQNHLAVKKGLNKIKAIQAINPKNMSSKNNS